MKDEKSINRVIQVDDTNIGENIRSLRERAGLKQSETVKKLQILGIDISIYSYNRIEKGTQNPTVSCLLALCNLFGCDMNDLFGFKK
jgi:transcriptional regulator with XRE-family HTH domain